MFWRHTRRGNKYVTVIIDLTPIRDGTGPGRSPDVVEGRSKQAFKQWLPERPRSWRDGIEVVATYGFTGFKTAAAEELPYAVAVMDPFHVARRTLHTRADLLTDKQTDHWRSCSPSTRGRSELEHLPVHDHAYHEPDRTKGRADEQPDRLR